MNHKVLAVRGLSGSDERAWRDLGARAIEPNPFYEADCVIPAALHQRNGAQIQLAVAEEGGRFLACMPVWSTLTSKVRYPVVTSSVRRMQYLGTPLVDPSATPDALATILSGLAAQRRLHSGRLLLLEIATADGPVAGMLRAAADQLAFPVTLLDSYERGLLRRRPDAAYDQIHSSKARYNLRRQRRLLSEHFGGSEVRVVDRGSDPSAVDDYIALEASGYKNRTGVAMAGVPGEPEWFTDMCRRLSAAGRLHILSLEVSDQTVAMEIWVRGGEGLFLIKISYDEQYAEFGPGVLLQTAAMQEFHDHTDAQWIDTCTSKGNEILLRLYPERRQIESLFIVLGRSVIDRAAVRAFLAARPLHRRLYQLRHPDNATVGTGHA